MTAVPPDERSERRRLAWRCRRGMKELDLLLGAWLERRWADAPAFERAAFERFVELPDPVIAAYLLGREEPLDADTAELVALLRGLRPA